MRIAIRRGHQKTGQDGCASGIVNEIVVAEDYKNKLIGKLKLLGHQVLDCTPSENNRTLADSLSYGVNMANNWGADLFISCHVNNAYNNYNGSIGCEVLYYGSSTKSKNYATKVEKELSKLGFKSRGPKADTRGLYELKYTKMPCIIVEPFFCEATGDISIYNKVGGEGIANAICLGVVDKTIKNNNDKTEVKKMVKYDETRPVGANIFPIGQHSYIEETEDSRTILHNDRGNYITIGKGFIDCYWNDNKGNAGSKRISIK